MNSEPPPTIVSDGWLDPAQRQAAARAAYRRSVEHGTPLSAAALAARFERSPRWAQDGIAEARNQRSALLRSRSADDSDRAHETATNAPPPGHPPAVAGRAQRLDTLIVAVVALVAAAASYQHQHSLAALAGEGWLAWALPIRVDGMMLATGRSILRRRRAHIPAPALSWFGFTLGLIASVAANVAPPTPPPSAGSSPPGHPSPCSSPTRPSPPTTATSPTPDPHTRTENAMLTDNDDHEPEAKVLHAAAGRDPRLTISVEEAGQLLGISRGLAYLLVSRGDIPSIRLGRRIVVPRRALEQLLDAPDDAA